MNDRQLDLGAVERIDAESFGEPGQRTFRIRARTGQGTVSLWLEKQQLAMLGSAVGELLERTPPDVPIQSGSETGSAGIVGDLEVHVGSLALGFDPDDGGFSLEAADFTSPFELSSISLRADRAQLEALQHQISDIVAQSRPRCPLCGRPLTDGPHFCPESNGHSHAGYPE